jgi:hypothetical protein
MFISKWNFFEKYCEWLFPLMFEAEKRIDTSNYTPYHKRVFAFLAERLLSVYVRHNKLKPYYTPFYFIVKELNAFSLLKENASGVVRKIIKAIFPRAVYKMMISLAKTLHFPGRS